MFSYSDFTWLFLCLIQKQNVNDHCNDYPLPIMDVTLTIQSSFLYNII